MSKSTIIFALFFDSLEAAMSQPFIVATIIFGFVLLLSLLLAEKPQVQPAKEAHSLTLRVNGKIASKEALPPSQSGACERATAGESWPGQEIAPVKVPIPASGAEALLMPLVAQFSQMQVQMFEQFQQTLLMMGQMFGNLQREQMTLIRQELEQIRELTRQLHDLQSKGMQQSASPLLASPQSAAPSSPTPSLSSKPTASAAETDTPSAKVCDPDIHVWLHQRLSALQQERQSRWQKVLGILTGQ